MKKIFTTLAAVAALALIIVSPGCKKSAEPEVRNVILMIGDGMGVGHVTALMIAGGYEPINMERGTHTGLVKTYSYNNRVTDSGASGTAYSTGHKTYNSRLAVDTLGQPLKTILEKGEESGMATGLVVSVGLNHATPATFYAHDKRRSDYEYIMKQLPGSGVDVAIGGGRKYMENRRDSVNLVAELESLGYFVADSLEGLDAVTEGKAMAVYAGGAYGIPYIVQGRDPQFLPKATSKALEILTNNTRGRERGFFMMVEGSQIDGASHDSDGRSVLAEVREFDDAVGVAFDYADAHPGTLVVVLADHETGGLAVVPGDVDFLKAESGVSLAFATTGHSGAMIPLFAYGTGAEKFTGVLENDEVGRRLQQALGLWDNER